jgi:hypothetical protein
MGMGDHRHALAASHQAKNPVPIVQEAGWASESVRMDMKKRKSPAPPGFQPGTVQPVTGSYTEHVISTFASDYRVLH